MKKIALIGVICGVLAACSTTISQKNTGNAESRTQFQQGLALFEQQNYDDALPFLQNAASFGNAQAGRYVGLIYLNGYGSTVKSPMNAFLALEKAAQLGDVPAQYWLGYAYENGVGVAQNPQLAAQYYRQAAKKGNDAAKQALARFHKKS